MSADDPKALRSRLTTRWAGHAHEHHAVIGSTNERALAWAREGAGHGALVTADAQVAGRGRRGRGWDSPPGAGLYASLVVRPSAGASVPALGLAVAVGLRAALPDAVGLKWPNDLVVDDEKLGGILCEARWVDGVAEIVAGFGINVRARAFPEPFSKRATSLQAIGAPTLHRCELLAALLVTLEDAIDDYLRGGFAAIRDRYESACTVLGRRIVLGDRDDPTSPTGIADHLADDGALVFIPDDGAPARRIEAADVWLAP